MLALFLKNPIWQISADDSKKLAVGVKNIAQYHSVSIDPRYAAYGSLALTAFAIYVPRIAIVNQQRKEAAKEAKLSQALNNVPATQGDYSAPNVSQQTHTGSMVFQ